VIRSGNGVSLLRRKQEEGGGGKGRKIEIYASGTFILSKRQAINNARNTDQTRGAKAKHFFYFSPIF
jgi:hypothetical protein